LRILWFAVSLTYTSPVAGWIATYVGELNPFVPLVPIVPARVVTDPLHLNDIGSALVGIVPPLTCKEKRSGFPTDVVVPHSMRDTGSDCTVAAQ
jgi:hypothetical protein